MLEIVFQLRRNFGRNLERETASAGDKFTLQTKGKSRLGCPVCHQKIISVGQLPPWRSTQLVAAKVPLAVAWPLVESFPVDSVVSTQCVRPTNWPSGRGRGDNSHLCEWRLDCQLIWPPSSPTCHLVVLRKLASLEFFAHRKWQR